MIEMLTWHSDTRPDRKLSRELLDYGLLGEGVVDTSKARPPAWLWCCLCDAFVVCMTDRVHVRTCVQVWIIKTHFPERFGYKRYSANKIILLVRNPFDTLDSYFNMVLALFLLLCLWKATHATPGADFVAHQESR